MVGPLLSRMIRHIVGRMVRHLEGHMVRHVEGHLVVHIGTYGQDILRSHFQTYRGITWSGM